MNKEEWLGLLEFEARWLVSVIEGARLSGGGNDIVLADSLLGRMRNLIALYPSSRRKS